jgi:hypothetical protein
MRPWGFFSCVQGLRVNLSKRGASLSIGHRGAWYTFGPHGATSTAGTLPRSDPTGRRV